MKFSGKKTTLVFIDHQAGILSSRSSCLPDLAPMIGKALPKKTKHRTACLEITSYLSG